MSGPHDGLAQPTRARDPSRPNVRDRSSRGRYADQRPVPGPPAHIRQPIAQWRTRDAVRQRAASCRPCPRGAARRGAVGPRAGRWSRSRASRHAGSRRSGRAALLEAVGRAATGDAERARARSSTVSPAPPARAPGRVSRSGCCCSRCATSPGRSGSSTCSTRAAMATPSSGHCSGRAPTLPSARYAEAVAAAQRAVMLAPDRKTPRTLLAQAAAQRDVHDPSLATIVPAPAAAHVPVPGHVLHIVSNALPARQSGYAIRTQSVGQAQLEVGLQPLIAARRQDDIRRGVKPPARWNGRRRPYGLTAIGLERAERPDQTAAMNARGIAAARGAARRRGAPSGHPLDQSPGGALGAGAVSTSRSCTRCAASGRRPGRSSRRSSPRPAPTTRSSRPSRRRSCARRMPSSRSPTRCATGSWNGASPPGTSP